MSDVSVSRKFLFDLDELYTKRKTKEITEEEFSIQRDALIAQEAKSQETIGPILITKELERIEAGVASTVNQKFLKEELDEINRANRDKIAKEAERKRIEREEEEKQELIRQENQKKLEDQSKFRKTVNMYIVNVEYTTKQWQRWFNWLQIILIVITTATASMAGFDGIPRGYVVVVGFAAAALGGILSYFQLQDKIYSSRKAIADLRLECQMYDHCLDEYKNRYADPEGAYLIFSKKVTAIQARHMLQEVELLNPKKKDTPSETNKGISAAQKKEDDSQVAGKDQSDGAKADAAKGDAEPSAD